MVAAGVDAPTLKPSRRNTDAGVLRFDASRDALVLLWRRCHLLDCDELDRSFQRSGAACLGSSGSRASRGRYEDVISGQDAVDQATTEAIQRMHRFLAQRASFIAVLPRGFNRRLPVALVDMLMRTSAALPAR